jgi:putative transcriptional regulator
MINYHPEARFLTDYAAGSLPASQALCVATHLHYCAVCRAKTGELNELGAELFCRQPPAKVKAEEFSQLMQRIDALPQKAQSSAEAPVERNRMSSLLPRALQKLTNDNLDSLRWRQIGRNFRFATLNLGDRVRETSLLFIKAGGNLPHHRHRGDEITVVLSGSFSDSEGKYSVGDFVVRTQGESHRPVASQDQDCLCLATLDAPIRMSNWLLRLAMLFITPRPVHA